MGLSDDAALVLLSGGQDSATCLGWALSRFSHVETVGFDYGQRHSVELACRKQLLDRLRLELPCWSARLGVDHVLDVSVIAELGETAMTGEVAIATSSDGLPNTFVPGRNLLFLTLAAALAFRRNIKHLVTGVCETDYSGYPDCRDDTIKALQVALNLGMARRFVLHTPLMWLDKGATWGLAHDIAGDSFVELIKRESHTCYLGDRTLWHEWGYGCGDCPACELRAAGWSQYARQHA